MISVGDGDGCRVLLNGIKTTIRLAFIDAPEFKQRTGKAARERLRELLPTGSKVSIKCIGKDRYGRTVAELFQKRRSLNLRLVREGHAVIYRAYFKVSRAIARRYENAEASAKKKRLGFWNQAKPVMPWDYRRK